jgi:hypothetical protein
MENRANDNIDEINDKNNNKEATTNQKKAGKHAT